MIHDLHAYGKLKMVVLFCFGGELTSYLRELLKLAVKQNPGFSTVQKPRSLSIIAVY